jgi:hypothetical protein
MAAPAPANAKQLRQKRIVMILGAALIVAGILVLALLHRVPLPMRIMAGLGDIFIGAVLLIVVRQQH